MNDATYRIHTVFEKTGFHPLDGACYLQSCRQGRLASLVVHHSEVQLRGLLSELDAFPRQCSPLSDALMYCDITTSPVGRVTTFQERIADIFGRYSEEDIVSLAIRQAVPLLSLAVRRTERKFNTYKCF